MLELLQAQARAPLDVAVRLGREVEVAARVLAVPVPEAVADERRRRLVAEASDKGEPVSEVRLTLADWAVYVTSIPTALLCVEEAVLLGAARWQIELLIKLWKSHGQIDLVRDVSAWQVLCELYGRLRA